jgi:hypothetical protein
MSDIGPRQYHYLAVFNDDGHQWPVGGTPAHFPSPASKNHHLVHFAFGHHFVKFLKDESEI